MKPAWCNFLVVLLVAFNLLGTFSSALLQFQLLSPKKMHTRDGCLVHSNIISCRVRFSDVKLLSSFFFSTLVVIADKVSSLMHQPTHYFNVPEKSRLEIQTNCHMPLVLCHETNTQSRFYLLHRAPEFCCYSFPTAFL